jgi:hypothetical protein
MPQSSTAFSMDWPRWKKTVRTILVMLIGLAIGWSFGETIEKPDCQDMDFGAYYRAALAVRQGRTPYTVDEHGLMAVYPYAPAFAYAFIPLTYLEYLWACRCWLLFNWLVLSLP